MQIHYTLSPVRKILYVSACLFISILSVLFFAVVSPVYAEPKNIIILIGDGMGLEHVKAAGMYAYGSAGTLLFEDFPYQEQVTTYSYDSSVTDSAAAATAIATHTKVNNGVVSVKLPGDGSELMTLLEYFKNSGKTTGLVTTTAITNATPAAFGAHEISRSNLSQIAQDLLQQTMPNVIFGAGGDGMSVSAAQTAGYTVVTDRASMQGLNTETATRVSGQFGTGQLPYEYDGSFATMPHLSEMTVTALAILDNDPDGFFLMVEGGLIDWAAHDNNLNRDIFETIEFSDTVQVVTDWAHANADTLIIVTADHETGGLLVTQNNGQGVLPSVTWSTAGHTGVNVGIYATGENAQLFTGTIDNTDIYAKVIATTNDPVDYYCDDDTDGYISSSISGSCTGIGCEPYSCQTTSGPDCNDGNDSIYPGAAEVVADGIDQDCNNQDRCYEDLDGDTYGSVVETDDVDSDLNCSTGANVSGNSADCNDGDALEYPGQTWYEDADGDLYSSGNVSVQCPRSVNYYADSELTATSGDCNDGDININPGEAEICDGTDNDCNAATGDGSGEAAPLNTLQAGVCTGSTQSCTGGAWTDDYSGVSGYEAVETTCDEQDNDCDSAVDEGLTSPIVNTTVPADGSTGMPINGSVTILWDKNVNCATVNTINIISDSPGWELSSCSGRLAVFNTSGQSGETIYSVTVTTAVTDISGCAMEANYQFSFRTNISTTLSIIEPDGSGDTVTAGALYSITYTLTDHDHVSTAAFYYDTDNEGFNGTDVTGVCSAAPEGTGVTCVWDTTGMTPGVYYIYGITNFSGSGTTRTWTGGGADTLASNTANWSDNSIPQNGDDVIFDSTSVKDCNWDINVPIHSISLNQGYKGTVTITSAIPLSGDSIIADGTLITGNATFYGNGQHAYSSGPITINEP